MTISINLLKLEVKTLFHTLTNILMRWSWQHGLTDKEESQSTSQHIGKQTKRGGLRDTEQHTNQGAGLAYVKTLPERLVVLKVETLSKRPAELEARGWLMCWLTGWQRSKLTHLRKLELE